MVAITGDRSEAGVTTQIDAGGVAVVTPWYPTTGHRFRGVFVRGMVEATAPAADSMTVYFCDLWRHSGKAASHALDTAFHTLVGRAALTTPTVANASLVRVPALARRGAGFAEEARASAVALRAALGGRPIPAGTVQAHVGLGGGWPALENAASGTRVFITEHASFLEQVLAEPESRQMYSEVLRRCTGFFGVGDHIRDTLSEAFPDYAHKISIIPNPISFEDPRPTPVVELRRWLFVGNLIPRKGVRWLIEAFARCRADDPTLHLTIVGDGALRESLQAQANELGVGEVVDFLGAAAPDEVLRLMRSHDLLVHPSRLETFGMTIIEAIAAGMPILVTRCNGPEQTLAGIDEAVGELVAVEESSDSLVAGYQRLRERFPHAVDLAQAHRHLADKYGYRAVAAAYHQRWFPIAGVARQPSEDLAGQPT